MDFSLRIKALCKARGITLTKLFDDIGISKESNQKWALGAIPQGSTIIKLAQYLGVSCDYLLLGVEPAAVNNGIIGHNNTGNNVVVKGSLINGNGKPHDELETNIIKLMRKLDTCGKAELLLYAREFVEKKKSRQ